VRLFRNQGMEQRYRNEVAGLNNRMTDIAAAIGRVQLRRLRDWNDERRHVASRYDAELNGVVLPHVAPGATHVYHQYTVRAQERDQMVAGLDARGVDAAVYYPVPTHRLPAYGLDVALRETDIAASVVLSLPIRPGMTVEDIDRVIAAVNDIVEVDRG
jgi:dTDP-4-amino-4,6-dideoxygalactose transaminase